MNDLKIAVNGGNGRFEGVEDRLRLVQPGLKFIFQRRQNKIISGRRGGYGKLKSETPDKKPGNKKLGPK